RASDLVQALKGGAKYLRYLTGLFGGTLDRILAAYSSGGGSVIKSGRRVPPFGETQGYVARGRVTYLRYLQSQFGDLGLERKAVDNVRATAYVQSRPSVSADEPNQDEKTPET